MGHKLLEAGTVVLVHNLLVLEQACNERDHLRMLGELVCKMESKAWMGHNQAHKLAAV